MKKILAIILILAMALFAGDGTFSVDADWSNAPYRDGELLSFQCTVDTLDTLYSGKFSLAKYDGSSFSTYPPSMGLLLECDADTPFVNIWAQGSFDGTNWFVVDTLYTETDSTTDADVMKYTEPDLNNYKAKWYRLKVQGTTGNSSTTSAKIWFYLYREDD